MKNAFHQIPLRREDPYITETVTLGAGFSGKGCPGGEKNGVRYCQMDVEVSPRAVDHIA